MKQLMVVIFIATSLNAAAQLSKNQWLIGADGNAGFGISREHSSFTLSFNPTIAFFPLNKFAVGSRLQTGFNNFDRPQFTIGQSVFTRYYVPIHDKIFLVPEVSSGVVIGQHMRPEINTSASLGLACFITENLAIEPGLGYTFFNSNRVTSAFSNLTSNLAIHYYFNRRKKH